MPTSPTAPRLFAVLEGATGAGDHTQPPVDEIQTRHKIVVEST